MYINTEIVRALMALRRIDAATLANVANVTETVLEAWLQNTSAEAEDLLAFDTQLEMLRVLGINGDTPRSDIVHYWYVHEPLFSLSANNYWALSVVTAAFGKADTVYFAKDADPLATTKAVSHFGLQFPSFKAILQVSAHPIRNIGFDPIRIGNLSWAPGNFNVLLTEDKYKRIAPGWMTPTVFASELNTAKEYLAWERLNLLARSNNIGVAEIEHLLLGAQQSLKTPQLTAEPHPSAASVTAPSPVITPVASPPAAAPVEIVNVLPKPSAPTEFESAMAVATSDDTVEASRPQSESSGLNLLSGIRRPHQRRKVNAGANTRKTWSGSDEKPVRKPVLR